MSQTHIETTAAKLLAARRTGARVALTPNELPRDFAEGYAIQESVVAGLGAATIGWKILPVPNGPMIFAPLLASGVVEAGGTWKALGREQAGIEVEIAFRMAADVAPDATTERVLAAVGSAHVVFELCQSRLADPASHPRHVTLADCVSNFGVVVGDSITGWNGKSLKDVAGRLLVDGKSHKEGRSLDPAYMLALLPAALASRGKKLEKGQIVITGSLVGMNWLNGHHSIEGVIDGCGRVACKLEAS
jgi:2-keto-4-pentenoate hydratase